MTRRERELTERHLRELEEMRDHAWMVAQGGGFDDITIEPCSVCAEADADECDAEIADSNLQPLEGGTSRWLARHSALCDAITRLQAALAEPDAIPVATVAA